MPPENSDRRRSAVIVRAGRKSTHTGWLTGAVPEYDLIVAAYEPLPPALSEAAHWLIPISGSKVAGWSALFMQHPEILDHYDQIALIDNDIICDARDINRCFALGREYQLSMWQPSLAWKSYFTYGMVLHNPAFVLRYTNFIEMMCPFFSTEHLRKALPLFSLGYETGIDLVWSRLQHEWRYSYAVIDSVQVFHSQPVGGAKEAQGFTTDYQDIVDQVDDYFGVNFRGPVAYAGVTRGGSRFQTRWQMALYAFAALRGIGYSPFKKAYLRVVTDHIRHNLVRPIGIDVPTAARPAAAPCSQILMDMCLFKTMP